MTKILIADDELNILTLAGAVFENAGMDVTTAVNGAEAIEKAIEIKPDIIITDIIMPEKNGFQVCKEVRQHEGLSDVPIIILSALGDDYNKLNGFEEGADDYLTKPFNIEELKARVNALLMRHKAKLKKVDDKPIETTVEIEKISTGSSNLDNQLYGGIPKGSNILILGPIGKGKSSFVRQFMCEGLKNSVKSLFICMDDDPNRIRKRMNTKIDNNLAHLEDCNTIKFIDAYSWSSFTPTDGEEFAVSGVLDLNHLSGLISDASQVIGQSIQEKKGGRRVIDSISSLLINFELPDVQRFLSQIARTSIPFGNVTTLFVLEEGTVSDQVLNNVKYIMDGIIEFNETNDVRQARVQHMKWSKYNKDWTALI
ncbi:response regulator [bacterium]|jgi:CheY-like chemotaxis protein|nr:response regulator [bacterium]